MLAPLVEGIDISPAAMPHLSMREGRICGVPTRLARVSFTGELGFEVNVAADYGRAVWEAIWAEGRKVGCVVYGLDTLLILRAEKGFIVVGQETDGTVTPDDLGMGRMVGKNKPDFIGKRSLLMADLARQGRKQLVGLLPEDTELKLDEGAQIVGEEAPAIGSPALGHVTSAYWSPTLQRGFAMALVADGRVRLGSRTHVMTMEGTRPAQIVEPIFYDKEGKRLDA
jgi:sarcosine oxidase subunit alpha